MSMFSLGGNLGVAIGPALVTVLILGFGLGGTLVLAAPPLLAAALLVADQRRFGAVRAADAATAAAATGPGEAPPPAAWGPFARLGAAISCRSIVHYGLITFVPLYLVVDLHTSEAYANGALTAMLVAGAGGTIAGGRLADRVGPRRVFAMSVALLPPLIVGLLLSGPVLAVAMLVAAGAATIATFSVTVVMGQEMLPGRVGLASGVTLGLAIGIGGAAASLLGVIADAHGLRTVLVIVAAIAVVTVALALTLPREPARPRAEPEPRTGGPAQASAEAR
jgi:FSR family fosmidomycin resistance protein-like MFS transporter